MSDHSQNTDSKAIECLHDLLNYVHHVGMLNQKPAFTIAEYNQLNLWEHQLKGRIGVHHNLEDDDGNPIWLRIERLKRISPPLLPEVLQEWVTLGNDPEKYPNINDKIIKTVPEDEVEKLLNEQLINKKDIRDHLKNETTTCKLKDVIFRLDNLPEIKKSFDQ